MKQRQKDILKALQELGGSASTWRIAERVKLNVNGVAQSLNALHEHVQPTNNQNGGGRTWKLKNPDGLKTKQAMTPELFE